MAQATVQRIEVATHGTVTLYFTTGVPENATSQITVRPTDQGSPYLIDAERVPPDPDMVESRFKVTNNTSGSNRSYDPDFSRFLPPSKCPVFDPVYFFRLTV